VKVAFPVVDVLSSISRNQRGGLGGLPRRCSRGNPEGLLGRAALGIFHFITGRFSPMNTLPPPSINEDEEIPMIIKVISSIIGILVSVALYTVLTNGILEILRDAGAIDWNLSIWNLASLNALVIAIRVWDRAIVDPQ